MGLWPGRPAHPQTGSSESPRALTHPLSQSTDRSGSTTLKPVIVGGHICLDLVPALSGAPAIQPGRLVQVGPLALSAGGCVGNTGLTLASLGVPVKLVGSVGADQLGRVLRSMIRRSVGDASGIRRCPGFGTSYSVVFETAGRDRAFWHHIGANAEFDGSAVTFEPGATFHLGYPTHLPALYADHGAALSRLLRRARDSDVTISIDLAAIDPASDATDVDWQRVFSSVLRDVDVITPSVDDLAALFPDRSGVDPIDWADLLLTWGAAVVMVTHGAAGLYLRTGTERRLQAAGPSLRSQAARWAERELWVPSAVDEVRSTTGAGDAAAAGLLAGLTNGNDPVEAAKLAALTAAARIAGGPIADSYHVAGPASAIERPSHRWRLGRDAIYHGPRDGRFDQGHVDQDAGAGGA